MAGNTVDGEIVVGDRFETGTTESATTSESVGQAVCLTEQDVGVEAPDLDWPNEGQRSRMGWLTWTRRGTTPSMDPQPDPIVIGIVFALASFIVAAGWFVAVALVWVFLRRKIAAMKEEHGELPPPEANALLFYALAVFFWPAGFVLGMNFLREPKTALQGRNCIAVGLADISVIVVLTCLGTTLVGFLAPGWIGGI